MAKKTGLLKYSFILSPFVIMLIGLITNIYFDSTAYHPFSAKRFEVKYVDNDVPIVGNIFYPKNPQEKKCPAVIYVSGFMAQKDIDPRIAIEFCRRGFVVVAIDIHGHGEMNGFFSNSIIKDVQNAIQYVKTNLNDKVDINKISLIGHSAGGYAVLGANRSSVAAAVTWAAASFYDEKIIHKMNKVLSLYNPDSNSEYLKELNKVAPYNTLTKTNTKNLLIIHHESDPVISINHAKAIHLKTNCKFIQISRENRAGIFNIFNIPLLNHYLIHNSVLVNTINWIESKSNLKRKEIDHSYNFVYMQKFYSLLIFFFGFLTGGMSIILLLKRTPSENITNISYYIINNPEAEGGKYRYLSLLSPIVLFGGLYTTHLYVESLNNIRLHEYFNIPAIILFIFSILYFIANKTTMKLVYHFIELMNGLIFGLYFITTFFLFTWNFKFFVLYPHKISYYFTGLLIVLPWFVVSSIVFFRILGNDMVGFISGKLKIHSEKLLLFIKFFLPCILGILYYMIFLSMMNKVFYIFIVIGIIIILHIYSTLMYYKRRSIIEIALMNSVIVSYFYGVCYWFFNNSI